MYKALGLFIILFLCSASTFVCTEDTQGGVEDYLWPTDASKYLTSAFCEYRGRRFHAGIDIKTWGRVGYHVFAVRPGYVWRISVSPYGYGKAVYLKLDTGEIAVYAHLSKFSDKIQQVVEAEQKRLGKYRINKYLKPGALPIAQGEIIGYTGQTGIGAPHLHFEIRDSGNRPINPLSKGYQIPDKVSPIVTGISMTPLDANSEVNGDFKPVILLPKPIGVGKYTLKEPVSIWGNVGLAISCYDKGSNSFNRYGIYSLKLYVDDILRFQLKYDKFSFRYNQMVDLERDYRLARRGFGRFYKLYKEKYNTLSYYFPNEPWAGVLRSMPLTAMPDLQSKAKSKDLVQGQKAEIKSQSGTLRQSEFQTGTLFPGLHEFKIEAYDYFGNVSTVQGKLQVGAAFEIFPIISENVDGELILSNIFTNDLRKIEAIDLYYLNGKRWSPISFTWKNNLAEKGGEGPLFELEEGLEGISLIKPSILKIIARDQFGTASYPFISVYPEKILNEDPPDLKINFDFYDDYIRLEINSNSILRDIPQVILNPGRSDSMIVNIYRKDLLQFIGKIKLDSISKNIHQLQVTTQNLNGEEFTFWKQITFTKINPSKAERLMYEDNNFWINFWLGSLYKPIYGRIRADTLSVGRDNNFVGKVYEVEPRDVPLNAGANVHIRFPQDEPHPEKLGIYYQNRKGKWVFIDNKIDTTNRTIWAKVFSLERFILIRDEEPPEIIKIYPINKARITTQTPLISVYLRDRLSGIGSENDIVMRLDAKKLIAEYDPERHRIFYQVKEPLSKGRHEITIWVQDNSKNVTQRKTVFWIE